MGLDTDTSKNSKNKEFETLLNEDFKKRDFKEGKIIKAVVSEIGKKHIFVETGIMMVSKVHFFQSVPI